MGNLYLKIQSHQNTCWAQQCVWISHAMRTSILPSICFLGLLVLRSRHCKCHTVFKKQGFLVCLFVTLQTQTTFVHAPAVQPESVDDDSQILHKSDNKNWRVNKSKWWINLRKNFAKVKLERKPRYQNSLFILPLLPYMPTHISGSIDYTASPAMMTSWYVITPRPILFVVCPVEREAHGKPTTATVQISKFISYTTSHSTLLFSWKSQVEASSRTLL